MTDTSNGLTIDQIKFKVKKIDMCMPSNEYTIFVYSKIIHSSRHKGIVGCSEVAGRVDFSE